MPKLFYYKRSEYPEYPEHAIYEQFTRDIYAPSDDPEVPVHLALSHELAHFKKHEMLSPISEISGEIEAWEETIRQLKSSGEWNEKAKDFAIMALATCLNPDTQEKREEEAKWWINRLESRIDRELRGFQ